MAWNAGVRFPAGCLKPRRQGVGVDDFVAQAEQPAFAVGFDDHVRVEDLGQTEGERAEFQTAAARSFTTSSLARLVNQTSGSPFTTVIEVK